MRKETMETNRSLSYQELRENWHSATISNLEQQ